MQIQLNGQAHDVPGPVAIDALLETLGLDPRLVAVERNRAVVRRAEYAQTTIEANDEIEIVAFVGGG
jgi:thiamine biosynthesis protein ThiS